MLLFSPASVLCDNQKQAEAQDNNLSEHMKYHEPNGMHRLFIFIFFKPTIIIT